LELDRTESKRFSETSQVASRRGRTFAERRRDGDGDTLILPDAQGREKGTTKNFD